MFTDDKNGCIMAYLKIHQFTISYHCLREKILRKAEQPRKLKKKEKNF